MRTRSGNIAIQIALSMTVLLGVTAVVIDIGRGRVVKQQLKNASEAAAHAGAAQLDGTVEGIEAAREAAVAIAAENLAAGVSVTLDANDGNSPTGDIVVGYWEDGAFVPSTTPADATTVQVVSLRPDTATYFAGVAFDTPTVDIGDFAIAQAGGPSAAGCPLPIALPDCQLTNETGFICGADILLSNDRLDNGAWARIGGTQANASYIRASLDPTKCAAASDLGDLTTLNNGAVNSALAELGKAVNTYGVAWDTAAWGAIPAKSAGSVVNPYGKALVGQIMVFDDPNNCNGTKFTGTQSLVGYATIIVYDVANSGSNKRIKAKTLCTITDGAGGGGFFGTTVPPNFVE
jgi:Flp pilus assembly protein TadG